jgi:hypothetical protein
MRALVVLSFIFLVSCATQKTHQTRSLDVVLNPTHGIEDCKFLNVIDVEASDEWQDDIRKAAAEAGANAVTAKAPERIDERAQKERVVANTYLCPSLIK